MAITFVAFVIRLAQMRQGLFGDELSTFQDVVGRSLGSVLRTVNVGPENSPPLFFVLSWFSSKLGDPTVWLRLPSLLLGTATIPLVYVIGRDVVDRTTGLIASAVIALSPFFAYYGVEARPYATMTFFVALSTLAVIRAVRTHSWRWWAAFTLAASAAVYSHYTAVFVTVTQIVWAVWVCRDRVLPPLLVAAAITVLYLPWLPHLRGKTLGVIEGLHALNVQQVLIDLVRPIAGYPYAPLSAIPTAGGLVILAVGALAGAVAVVRKRLESAGRRKVVGSELRLIVALALVTPVGLLVYSLFATDLWLARGLSASVPCAAVVYAATLSSLPRRWMGIAAGVSLLVLVAGTLLAVSPRWSRPPYREIAAHLDEVATPAEAIIAYPSLVGEGVPLYFRQPHRVLTPSPAAWRAIPPGGRGYVLIYALGTLGLHAAPTPVGFRLTARVHYTGVASTDVFTYIRQ